MIKNLLIFFIRFYKGLVSPFLPPSCRFHPSCSDYAKGAIQTHGAVNGAGLSIKRLLRCHPFNAGGYDPVPHFTKKDFFKKLKRSAMNGGDCR